MYMLIVEEDDGTCYQYVVDTKLMPTEQRNFFETTEINVITRRMQDQEFYENIVDFDLDDISWKSWKNIKNSNRDHFVIEKCVTICI